MAGGLIVLLRGLIPPLAAFDAAHAGVAGFVPSVVIKNGIVNPVRWALWGGTAIMLFSSLTSVALQWQTLVRAFRLRRNTGPSADNPLAAIEVPGSWLVAGLLPITIGLVIVQWLAFHIS